MTAIQQRQEPRLQLPLPALLEVLAELLGEGVHGLRGRHGLDVEAIVERRQAEQEDRTRQRQRDVVVVQTRQPEPLDAQFSASGGRRGRPSPGRGGGRDLRRCRGAGGGGICRRSHCGDGVHSAPLCCLWMPCRSDLPKGTTTAQGYEYGQGKPVSLGQTAWETGGHEQGNIRLDYGGYGEKKDRNLPSLPRSAFCDIILSYLIWDLDRHDV